VYLTVLGIREDFKRAHFTALRCLYRLSSLLSEAKRWKENQENEEENQFIIIENA
jgi:hypothetical protein